MPPKIPHTSLIAFFLVATVIISVLTFVTRSAAYLIACCMAVAAFMGGGALMPWLIRRDWPLEVQEPAEVKVHQSNHACQIMSLAVGLGLLSIAILGVGFLGGYQSGWVAVLLVVFALTGVSAWIVRHRKQERESHAVIDLPSITSAEPWRPVDFILAFLLVAAGVVMLPGAVAPSVNYDVLEYHLGGPRDLMTAGQYAPCPHNVYTWMPAGAQMLFLGGVIADGGALGGTPRVMVAFFYLGLLWLTAALGRAAGLPRWARLAGAAIVAAHPLLLKLTMNALADLPVAWFVGAALLAALAMPRGGARMAALAGVILGFAVWFKLTVLKIFVPPFVMFILLPMLWSGAPAGNKWRSVFIGLLVFFASLALPVLPHLVKNAILLGNPFYPALSGLFPTPDLWTPAQTEFWNEAHGVAAFFSADHWRNVFRAHLVLSYHPLILIPLAVLLLWRRGAAWRLIGFALASYFLWADTRQAPDRFLAPLVPVMGLLAALLLGRLDEGAARHLPHARWRSAVQLMAASGVFLLAMPMLLRQAYYFHGLHYYDVTRSAMSPEGFLHTHLNPGFVEMMIETNAATEGAAERGERLLLLYEARAALFTAPLLYNTVHDQAPLLRYAREAADASEMAARMRADGIRWVLLNEREMARLIQFFAPEAALRERGVERTLFLESPGLAERHLDLYEPYWLAADWPVLEPKVRAFHELVRARAVVARAVAPGWPWFVTLAELPAAAE